MDYVPWSKYAEKGECEWNFLKGKCCKSCANSGKWMTKDVEKTWDEVELGGDGKGKQTTWGTTRIGGFWKENDMNYLDLIVATNKSALQQTPVVTIAKKMTQMHWVARAYTETAAVPSRPDVSFRLEASCGMAVKE
ncbi:hypothetical protein PRIPAC_77846 [Pristionchus pacificus]|uniref:Uncharacterized protein n=1 Tax=Pristionchus pacificus TaxID=54126 RepID=A0A2A6CNZ2_PRIPA|nr:hypothetical protein PRIPAC_77846 [Pristionchus pacificus]|eukprot:PDM79914.1 hypothetical protein PRIPAC_32493 [Pristionchus pacificus]